MRVNSVNSTGGKHSSPSNVPNRTLNFKAGGGAPDSNVREKGIKAKGRES